jgi:hypothetical protein
MDREYCLLFVHCLNWKLFGLSIDDVTCSNACLFQFKMCRKTEYKCKISKSLPLLLPAAYLWPPCSFPASD